MAINQAMGTLRGREAGARYLRTFVDEMKTSGFVAQAFARNRIDGASRGTLRRLRYTRKCRRRSIASRIAFTLAAKTTSRNVTDMITSTL